MANRELELWAQWCACMALQDLLGRLPMAAEAYALQSVCRIETLYGLGWKSPPHARDMVGSNNMGANQCREHWKQYSHVYGPGKMPDLSNIQTPSARPGCCALVVDSSPSAQGPSWYSGPYKINPDPIAAFKAVANIMIKMGAIEIARITCAVEPVSRALYRGGYYQGRHHNDPEANIQDHAAALGAAVRAIALALVESPGLGGDPREMPPARPWSGYPPVLPSDEAAQCRMGSMLIEEAHRTAVEERNRYVSEM